MFSSTATAIITTSVVFVALAILSVLLRFYARRRQSIGYGIDDWLIITALIMAVSLAITNIVGVTVGKFGSKFETLDEEETELFLKIFFALQFLYITAVAVIKLAVLALYRRVFAVRRTPTVYLILAVLTVAWWISFFFATLFQILPIYCNWVTCAPTANYPVMYILSSVTDIILDVAILCCPIFFLKALHINQRKKVALAIVFGLGAFCIVASLARLVYTVKFYQANIVGDIASDLDVSADYIVMWSAIESSWSTICASLPVYSGLVFGKGRLAIFKSSTFSLRSYMKGSSADARLFRSTRNVSKMDPSRNQSPAVANKASRQGSMGDGQSQEVILGDVELSNINATKRDREEGAGRRFR